MLRGIAALSVVFHHSWSIGTMPRFAGYWMVEGFGTWGVSLFFMLSGFLLADHFWRGEREGRLRTFYVRRVFRIVPAYYLNVAVLFLFFAQHDALFSRTGAQQVAANLTFTQYLRPETASNLNVNGVLWTLSIEAILYLVIPLLAWFVGRTFGIGALVLVLVGLSYRLYVSRAGAGLQDFYFGAGAEPANARLYLARQFLGVLPLFALGIGLKWLTTQRRLRLTIPLGRFPTSMAIIILLTPSVLWLVFVERASFYTHWVWFTGFDFVLGLLFAPAILFVASPLAASTMVDRIAVWVGERSYGLYLWHFPIILTVYGRGPFLLPPNVDNWPWKMALILGLSLTAAHLSWKFLEEPAQRAGRRWAKRPERAPTA